MVLRSSVRIPPALRANRKSTVVNQVTVRSQQEWRSKFFHLAMRRARKIAKVAMARKLAVHLYWMWRQGCDYGQTQKLGSHAGSPEIPTVSSKSPT